MMVGRGAARLAGHGCPSAERADAENADTAIASIPVASNLATFMVATVPQVSAGTVAVSTPATIWFHCTGATHGPFEAAAGSASNGTPAARQQASLPHA